MSDYAFFFLDAKKQNLFRNFREAIFRHEQMIPVQELSVDEINLVIKAVLTDTPEFFWFEGKWEYQRIGDMQYIHPIYTFDIAAFYEIQSQIDQICTNILMTAKDFTRDFDKIRLPVVL